MIFRNFAERLLGSKVKVKLVADLLGRTIPASERELARVLGISHVAVNKAMKDFEELNLVQGTKIGNSLVWTLNTQSYAYTALRDLKRLSVSPVDALRSELSLELNPFTIVQQADLFGSIVSGTETAKSDIDLLVICSDKKLFYSKLVNLSKKISEEYGNSLHCTLLSPNESKKPNWKKLLQEIRRNGLSVIAR